MDASTFHGRNCPAHPSTVEGQLAFYGIDDPLWLPLLLRALRAGGCVMVERTGDLLIMGGVDTPGRLDT
jgi:hypothetical protein